MGEEERDYRILYDYVSSPQVYTIAMREHMHNKL